MSTVIPYDSTELKGVWIRPTFYNEKDIIKTLDQLAEAGINNIFLETYYHGKTIFTDNDKIRIYPSELGVCRFRSFKNMD